MGLPRDRVPVQMGDTAMEETAALDAGKDGVRVNAVDPGFTETGMIDELLNNPEPVAKFEEIQDELLFDCGSAQDAISKSMN